MGSLSWMKRFLLGLLALAALSAGAWLWGALVRPDPGVSVGDAVADAFSGGQDAWSPDAGSEPSEDAGFEVGEAATARGEVVNGETEAPLAGAVVVIQHGGGEWRGECDAQGRFEAEGLRPGKLTVEASLPGWSGGGAQAAPLPLDASPGQRIEDVRVTLFEDGALTGQLLLGDQPGQAQVTLHYIYDASGSMDLTLPAIPTSDSGRFDLEGLPPGQVRVEASDGRYVLADPPEVLISGGSRTDLGTLTLVFGAALRGEVRDTISGRPIPQAAIALVDGDKTRFRRMGARADTTGRFVLAGVVGTHGVLEVSAVGYQPRRQEVEVAPGQRLDLPPITLSPQQGLSVRVLDSAQQPVNGAVVTVRVDPRGEPLWTATTADDGVAQLDALEGGPFILRAVHASAGASRDVLGSAGQQITLTLGPPSALVGHIRGSDGSTPHGITVAVLRADNRALTARQDLDAAAGGYFSFSSLEGGMYVVEAAASGFSQARSAPVEVTAGRETRLTLTLAAGGVITGVVRDATTGAPVAGANVQIGYARRALGGPLSASTDADGRFRVDGVDPERKTVEVSATGYITRMVSGVQAPSGRSLTIDVALSPSTTGSPNGMQLVGIGATLSRDGQGVVIQRTIEGSAAASLGLREGDRILSVDGQPVGDLDLYEVIERIRGEEGTPVRLTIERDGAPPQDYSMTRKPVTVE
jgi:hypothetical protein